MGIQWISHRGVKERWVENTQEAFDEAVENGFHCLETDLQITQDGHLVLSHDDSLSRLMGDDRQLSQLNRLEIERLRYPNGQSLMFFDQFAQRYRPLNWTLDMKPENGAQIIEALYRFSERGGFELKNHLIHRTRYLCWQDSHQKDLLRRFPDAEFYAQEKECWRAGLFILVRCSFLAGIQSKRVYSLPPKVGGLRLYKERNLKPFRERGAKVLAFLPHHPQDIQDAVELQFDEILIDGPIPPAYRTA